jgi:uncharacterized protein HemY
LELESGRLRTDEQREKAIELLLENAKSRADDHKIYLRLAEIAVDFDEWTKAYTETKKYLAKAEELNNTDNTVKDKQGDLEIKDYRHKFNLLQAQLKVKPEDAELKTQVKNLYDEMLAYQVKEFERRVKAQPMKADFHNSLGMLYFQTKRYEEAIAELQSAS